MHSKPVTHVVSAPAILTSCSLSVIVPAFNEEERLPITLARIAEYQRVQDLSTKLLIVDDGSRYTPGRSRICT